LPARERTGGKDGGKEEREGGGGMEREREREREREEQLSASMR
jgi:hypothetical protein